MEKAKRHNLLLLAKKPQPLSGIGNLLVAKDSSLRSDYLHSMINTPGSCLQ